MHLLRRQRLGGTRQRCSGRSGTTTCLQCELESGDELSVPPTAPKRAPSRAFGTSDDYFTFMIHK